MQNPNEEPFFTEKELRRIIRTSIPGSSVHSMANALLHNWQELPEYDGAQYLQILEGRFSGSRARILAAESLRFAKIDPETACRAEATLCRIVSKRDLPGWIFFLVRLGNLVCRYWILGILYAVLIQLAIVTKSDIPFIMLSALYACINLMLPFVSFYHDGTRRFQLRRKCAAALGRVGGPGSIGVLMSAIEEGSHWSPAKSALRNVLMHLTHEDYGHVSAHTIGRLNKMLLKPFQPGELEEWVPLLIDTLGKVGNGSSVEPVEKIANKGRTPEWREQASRALQILRVRQKLERDSSRLLRATTSEETPDTLLRPAGVDSGSNNELLLHAVQDDFVH